MVYGITISLSTSTLPLRWHRIENNFLLVWRVWKEASQIFDQHENP
ncbi:unnamed protein product [Ectocarpus sp. CCAP 1310/34]|nr:unnamed protein product [Ectocarpus sp. CCAP 1310/34]